MPDVTATVTDRSGHTASAVASYTVGAGGPLAPGVRATPGTVGYLGNPSSLTWINSGQSLTGTPLAGKAVWEDGVLKVTAANFTMSGIRLNTQVYSAASSGTFTVQNCILHDEVGAGWYGIYASNPNVKVIARDTTLTVPSINGKRSVGVAADSNLVEVYRCDISGYEDCIAGAGASIVDQCYLHGLDDLGTDPHNDVIQHYNVPLPGAMRVTNTDMRCTKWGNESVRAAGASASLTFHDDGCVADNNYFEGGAAVFRIEGATNVVFTNNDFGPLKPGEFMQVSREGGSIAQWANNWSVDGDGNPISLIPQP